METPNVGINGKIEISLREIRVSSASSTFVSPLSGTLLSLASSS